MKTLKIPFWAVDLTKKYWEKHKSPKVKKTGVGERIDKAQSLYSKIKWELFDPSKTSRRSGQVPVISKLAATQAAPLKKLLGEIVMFANKAARTPESDADMGKHCDQMVRSANSIMREIDDYTNAALANAAEYDAAAKTYAADLTAFVKDFIKDIKTLETDAQDLAAKAATAQQLVRDLTAKAFDVYSEIIAPKARQAAAAAAEAGAKLKARRPAYQTKMLDGTRINPALDLTALDIQAHENLLLTMHNLFARLDKINDEVDANIALAAKCDTDIEIIGDKGIKMRNKKAASDIRDLEGTLDNINRVVASMWGTRITQKGDLFAKTTRQIAESAPDEKQAYLVGALDLVHDASAQMPKALTVASSLLQTLAKNCSDYKEQIPLELRFPLSTEIKRMEAILKAATQIVAEFEKNYTISMKQLQLLDDAIKKHSK